MRGGAEWVLLTLLAACGDNGNVDHATHRIGGLVHGVIQEGVTIELGGDGAGSVVTDSTGGYQFAGLGNGSYTLTASLVGYEFAPAIQTITISDADVLATDFVATTRTYAISGTMTGDILGGVTIELSGPMAATTTTSGNGSYVFYGLPTGAYTVTASLVDYTFSPPRIDITLANAGSYGNDFAATRLFNVAVATIGNGNGTITSAPSGIACGVTCSSQFPKGSVVTLTAATAPGSVFGGFMGDCASAAPSCMLTVDNDRGVTAIIEPITASRSGNQLALQDGAVAVRETQLDPPPNALDLTTFTIEAWIFPLADRDMIVAADSGYALRLRGNPLRAEFAVMTTNGFPAFKQFAGTSRPLELGRWNHVVGMMDAAGTLSVGVNGELAQIGPSISMSVSTAQTFSIGNSFPASLGDFPFVGRIDEVRLSNVARYTGNFTPSSLLDPDQHVIGLWHFDEAAQSTGFASSSATSHPLAGVSGAATILGNRVDEGAGNALFYSLSRVPVTQQFAGPVATGDIDSDGDVDLAVVGLFAIASDKVVLYANTGAGNFAAPTFVSLAESGAHPDIVITDLDRNGIPDLIASNFQHNDISVLLGTGGGAFGAATTIAVGTSPGPLAVGDFDFDGDVDLAVGNVGDDTVSILLGDGLGGLTATSTLAVARPRDLAAADLDGDNVIDLAVASETSNSVVIFAGNGDSSFSAGSSIAVGTQPSSLVISDLDGDADVDIAVLGNPLSLLFNDGNAAFTRSDVAVAGDQIAAGDLDGDGDVDLATAGAGPDVAVLRNAGAGAFAPPVSFLIDTIHALSIRDLTNDGHAELIVSDGQAVNMFTSR